MIQYKHLRNKVNQLQYYVYILTNWNNKVIYTGVTNNLERRIFEHKNGVVDGFTKKYNVHKLVWFDYTNDIRAALETEKQIKGWTRAKKNALVEKSNPSWRDLSEDF
ncbi:MAG: GIY-YIG nuclease family protein [Clostridia bacterium]|nr:GIY-YIG nuclease family protein [Clostridia bacterium]